MHSTQFRALCDVGRLAAPSSSQPAEIIYSLYGLARLPSRTRPMRAQSFCAEERTPCGLRILLESILVIDKLLVEDAVGRRRRGKNAAPCSNGRGVYRANHGVSQNRIVPHRLQGQINSEASHATHDGFAIVKQSLTDYRSRSVCANDKTTERPFADMKVQGPGSTAWMTGSFDSSSHGRGAKRFGGRRTKGPP